MTVPAAALRLVSRHSTSVGVYAHLPCLVHFRSVKAQLCKNPCCAGEDPSLWDVYQSMEPPVDRSDWHIHDPSRITVTEDGTLMIGVTGKAQEDGYNCGLETWSAVSTTPVVT